jgi:hypothetical protein
MIHQAFFRSDLLPSMNIVRFTIIAIPSITKDSMRLVLWSQIEYMIYQDIDPDIVTNTIFRINGIQSNPLLCIWVALYERYQSGIHESPTASADPATP